MPEISSGIFYFERAFKSSLANQQKSLILHHFNRPHSSMDRISDSGSDDLGSNPDGVTKTLVNNNLRAFFLLF